MKVDRLLAHAWATAIIDMYAIIWSDTFSHSYAGTKLHILQISSMHIHSWQCKERLEDEPPIGDVLRSNNLWLMQQPVCLM